jgi:alkylation response protein AidB-like acyl-CoA dehydrogenase
MAPQNPSQQAQGSELLLSEQEQQWLRARAAEWADSDVVPEDIVAWLIERKYFKLFVPQELGGLGVSLSAAVRLYEQLAEIDGSLAWLVQIGAGGGFFVPALAPEVAARLFADPKAVVAGSGAVAGRALAVPGGYRVWGQWQYASGAQYATMFTANARLEDGTVRAFVFFPEQVCLGRDWHALGMRATSSWSFRVEDLFVPEELSFVVGCNRWDPGLRVYRLPFGFFAVASIGAVALGLGRALFREIAAVRRPVGMSAQLARWGELLEWARERFLQTVVHVEALPSDEVGVGWEYLLREALQMVRGLVLDALPAAGMVAVRGGERIERIVRDFLTLGQHRAMWRWQWAAECGWE